MKLESQNKGNLRKEKRGDSPPKRGPFLCLVIIGQGLEPQVVVLESGKGSVVEDELDEVAFDVVEAEGEVTDSRDLELRARARVGGSHEFSSFHA